MGDRGAENRVEGELRRAAHDCRGLPRVIHPRRSTMILRSPDWAIAGSATPSASTRRRSTSRVHSVDSPVCLDGEGIAGLKRDLGAAAQVQAQAR